MSKNPEAERGSGRSIVERIDHGLSKFYNVLTIVSVLAVVIVIIICVVDVVGSKLFAHPFAPAYEMTQMLSVPLVFFAVGSVQMGRGMMRIDLIANKLPKTVQRVINIIASICGVVLCGFLTWRSWVYTYGTLFTNHIKTTGNVKLLMWPFGVLLVIGLLTLTIAYIFTTLRYILEYDVLPDLSPDQLMAAAKDAATPEAALEEIYPDAEKDTQLAANHPGMGPIVQHKAAEATEEREKGADEK